MKSKDGRKEVSGGFGPISSRLYSLMARNSSRSERIYEPVSMYVSSRNPAKILDVGCGPGLLISLLEKRCPDALIYGVDPSRSMVELAKKRLMEPIHRGRVFLDQGDSQTVHFCESFDIIVSTLSFHHWNNRMQSLRYLSTLVSPGGSIIIYERMREDGREEKPGRRFHSLSIQEAETFEIPGFTRSVSLIGEMIALSFKKNS